MRKYGALALTLGAALALSACTTAEELPKPVAATIDARPAISTDRLTEVQEIVFVSPLVRGGSESGDRGASVRL